MLSEPAQPWSQVGTEERQKAFSRNNTECQTEILTLYTGSNFYNCSDFHSAPKFKFEANKLANIWSSATLKNPPDNNQKSVTAGDQ